jgi:hypothetical protein
LGRLWNRKTDKVELTDLERRALSSVGGSSVFQFSQNLMADRANFIKFFDAEVKSQFVEAAATQEARALVGENTPPVRQLTSAKQAAELYGAGSVIHCSMKETEKNIPPEARHFLASIGITEPEGE